MLILSILIVFAVSLQKVTKTQEITFLQYNLHLFGGTTEFPVFYHDEERREEICEHIKRFNPDVVSLVEVWSKEYKYKMVECLNVLFPHFQLHETPPTELGNGLVLLSKFPIENNATEFVKYKHLAGMDMFSEKGIMGTIINVPGLSSFRMFTTHDQADVGHWDTRMKNLNTAFDFITGFYNHDLLSKTNEFRTSEDLVTPAIATGDFNLGLNGGYEKEFTYFTSLFGKNQMVDAFGLPAVLTPTVDPTTNNMAEKFDGKKYPPERDDFLLMTSKDWETTDFGVITDWLCVKNESHCSDHYPIYTKLKFSVDIF